MGAGVRVAACLGVGVRVGAGVRFAFDSDFGVAVGVLRGVGVGVRFGVDVGLGVSIGLRVGSGSPGGSEGLSTATKAETGPSLVAWRASPVTGKLAEVVLPAT